MVVALTFWDALNYVVVTQYYSSSPTTWTFRKTLWVVNEFNMCLLYLQLDFVWWVLTAIVLKQACDCRWLHIMAMFQFEFNIFGAHTFKFPVRCSHASPLKHMALAYPYLDSLLEFLDGSLSPITCRLWNGFSGIRNAYSKIS
jgi:hypothetical protein